MHALLKHPLVDCDLEEAAIWYDRRSPAVAVRLIDASKMAMRAAAEQPLRFPIKFGDVRRVRLQHFPHSVFFVVRGDSVFVLAILHGANDLEGRLRGRMPPG